MGDIEVPDGLVYTRDHHWVAAGTDEAPVRIGLTAAVQGVLGEVVYVELPSPGSRLEQGRAYAEVESTKALTALVAPVGGTVVEVNSALQDAPHLVNSAPYGQGWLLLVRLDHAGALVALLGAAAYRREVGSRA